MIYWVGLSYIPLGRIEELGNDGLRVVRAFKVSGSSTGASFAEISLLVLLGLWVDPSAWSEGSEMNCCRQPSFWNPNWRGCREHTNLASTPTLRSSAVNNQAPTS